MSSGPGFARDLWARSTTALRCGRSDKTPRATTPASGPLEARHSLVKSATKALLLACVLSLLYASFAYAGDRSGAATGTATDVAASIEMLKRKQSPARRSRRQPRRQSGRQARRPTKGSAATRCTSGTGSGVLSASRKPAGCRRFGESADTMPPAARSTGTFGRTRSRLSGHQPAVAPQAPPASPGQS